jgi:DNA polymerase III gamma/tau subunit
MEIAIYSNGGLRDAISMLDKLASFSNNNITMDDFITINGLISQNDIIDAYNYIINKDAKGVLEIIDKIASVETDGRDKPLFEQKIKSVTVETFGKEYPSPETV